MFDLDAAFEEFVGLCTGGNDHPERTRALWDSLVNGEEAEACHADLMSRVTPGMRVATPEWVLRKLGAKLPSTETRQVVTMATLGTPAPKQSENYTAFRNAWSMWPKDPTRIAETESNASYAWDRSVAKNGLAATVAACTYYVRKSRTLAHPVNMATWLEDEVQFFAAEEKKQPTEADEAAFRAAYSRYPRPALNESEALDLYHARIRPEDRLAFLAAVIEYAADCRESGREKKYINKWSTFVTEEWRERETLGVLLPALQEVTGSCAYITGDGWTPAGIVGALVRAKNEILAQDRERYEAATPRDAVIAWEHSCPGTWVTEGVEGWVDGVYTHVHPRAPIETDRLAREPLHDGPYRSYMECLAVGKGLPCCCGDWLAMPPPPLEVDVDAVLAAAADALAASGRP